MLETSPEQAGNVSAAVVEAADLRFRRLADDPSLGYAFWLLTRVTWAARGADFIGELGRLGVEANANSTAIDVISAIGERVRHERANYPWTGHFGEFAALALRTALTETVAGQGPSLFDSTIQDTQRSFRGYSTEARFGELARRFFGNFMSRALRSFVDRALASHVGPDLTLRSSGDAQDFLQALDTHSWESALVVENFAGQWYSKNNWETQGDIGPDQAQRFVAQGLRKLRSELKRSANPQ